MQSLTIFNKSSTVNKQIDWSFQLFFTAMTDIGEPVDTVTFGKDI